jgi:DNA-binding Lrp family transcriptional regulator
MAKSSVKQLEQDEKKILKELSKNANKSVNDIAKICGFSRQKVWRVIKNLEKNKTIWGYTAVINQEKLNKKRYIMLMKRTNKPITKDALNHIITREIADKVRKWDIEFINSIYINGKYDWLLCFSAKNIRDAKNVVELYNQIYTDLISEIDLHEEMFTVQSSGINNPEIKKLKDFFNV